MLASASRLPAAARARARAPAAPRSRGRALRLHTSAGLLDTLRGLMGAQGSKADKGWAPRNADTPRRISRMGFDVTPLSEAERSAAAEGLTPLQRRVTLDHGTERAFTGTTVNGYSHDNKQRGLYVSALGGLPLFTSETKFNSGTGWPSFFAPIDRDHVVEVLDTTIPYMPRVEVLDARSGAHLGHVFDDGPAPTGKRYCINAAALRFIPEGQELPSESQPVQQ